jgi:hypothetical protein
MDAQIDAIEERTGEASAIALDLLGKARALALGIAPETARATVQSVAATTSSWLEITC